MFHALPAPFNSIVPFAIVLGVLVFVHEMGHYLAARWCGVHVEAFSIGFGRPIWSRTDRRGTVWRLSILPLGGYVKLHGQERPEDATPEQRLAWQPGRTFHEKGVGRRAIVIAAGPLANFLLAGLLYAGLLGALGRPSTLPVVSTVAPASAAAAAGLQPGDRILQIDGVKVATFEDIFRTVSVRPHQDVRLLVRRGTAELTLPATVGVRDIGGEQIGALGITSTALAYQRVSPPAALAGGFAQVWDVSRQWAVGLWQLLTGHRGTEDLGGPLRIAQLSGQVAAAGVAALVSFIAVLSVNLGLINLVPIPILDGGHLAFYALEALRGRPLPQRAQEYGFRAGLALIAALFVFVTWKDLGHLGVVRWVAGLIG